MIEAFVSVVVGGGIADRDCEVADRVADDGRGVAQAEDVEMVDGAREREPRLVRGRVGDAGAGAGDRGAAVRGDRECRAGHADCVWSRSADQVTVTVVPSASTVRCSS